MTYSLPQLAALLAACEARYQLATVTDAGQWLRSCHAIRDRVAMTVRVNNLQVQP